MGILEVGLMGLGGLLLFIVAGVVAAETDSALASGVTFILGLLVLNYGFNISVLSVLAANPLWIVGYIILYIGAGALYTALWRWPEYIRKNKEKILDIYSRWAAKKGGAEDNSFEAFMDSSDYRFNASQHKERLGTWVGMWPFSLFWELLRKPASWIWNTAYKSLGTLFQRIGRNTARKLHDKG